MSNEIPKWEDGIDIIEPVKSAIPANDIPKWEDGADIIPEPKPQMGLIDNLTTKAIGLHEKMYKAFAGTVMAPVTGQGILKLPKLISDLTELPVKLIVNRAIENEGHEKGWAQSEIETYKRANESVSYLPDGIVAKDLANSEVSTWLTAKGKEYENESQVSNENITDLVWKGDLGTAAAKIGVEIARSLPYTISALGGGVGLVAMGLTTASAEYDNIKDSDSSQFAKLTDAIMNGTTEALGEYLGTAQIGKYLGEGFKAVGAVRQSAAIKNGLEAYMSKIFKKYGLWATSTAEGVSEWATTIAQNAAAKYTGVDPERGIMDGTGDSFIVGFTQGGLMGGSGKLVQKGVKIYKTNQFSNQVNQQIAAIAHPTGNVVQAQLNNQAQSPVFIVSGNMSDSNSQLFIVDPANPEAGRTIVSAADLVPESISSISTGEYHKAQMDDYRSQWDQLEAGIDQQRTVSQAQQQVSQGQAITPEQQATLAGQFQTGQMVVTPQGTGVIVDLQRNKITVRPLAGMQDESAENFQPFTPDLVRAVTPEEETGIAQGTEPSFTPTNTTNETAVPTEETGANPTQDAQQPAEASTIDIGLGDKSEIARIVTNADGTEQIDKQFKSKGDADSVAKRLNEGFEGSDEVTARVVKTKVGTGRIANYTWNVVFDSATPVISESEKIGAPINTPISKPEAKVIPLVAPAELVPVKESIGDPVQKVNPQVDLKPKQNTKGPSVEQVAPDALVSESVVSKMESTPVVKDSFITEPSKPVEIVPVLDSQPKVGDTVFDNKKQSSATISRLYKPKATSALANEPFVIDLTYENGTKSISMPYDERFKAKGKTIDQQIEDQEVNENPTEAQKEVGNYKKAHIEIQGMPISVENPVGSVRKGKDEDGKAWEHVMKSHYGYFKQTQGHDGDHIDCFIGSNPGSKQVFVIDQVNPSTGVFDESKVMIGYNSAEEARQAYSENYDKDWKGLSAITEVDVEPFKEWLHDGYKQRKPFAEYKDTPNPIQDGQQGNDNPISTDNSKAREQGLPNGNTGTKNGVKKEKGNSVAVVPELTPDQKISSHNTLVGVIDNYNNLPANHTNKKRQAFQEIQSRSQKLGLQIITLPKGKIEVQKEGAKIKRIAIKEDAETTQAHKALSEYDEETQGFINSIIDNPVHLNGLEIVADIIQGARNIKEGKKTVAANAVLDALEAMHNDGVIRLRKTINTPRAEVPVSEYFAIFNEPLQQDAEAEMNATLDGLKENLDAVVNYFELTPIESEEIDNLFIDYGYESQINPEGKEGSLVEGSAITGSKEVAGEIQQTGEITVYQKQINELVAEKTKLTDQRRRKEAALNERNGLFGDVKQSPNDMFAGAGFDASQIPEVLRKFDDQIKAIDTQVEKLKQLDKTGKKEASGQIKNVIPEEKPKRITSDSAKDAALARLRAKRGKLNTGIDPQEMLDAITVASWHVETGARKFIDFSKNMISNIGEWIRPYLAGIYENVRRNPDTKIFAKDFDTTEYVDNFDIDNLSIEEDGNDQDADNRDGRGRDGSLEAGGEPAGDIAKNGERGAGSSTGQNNKNSGKGSGVGTGSNKTGNKQGSGKGIHDGPTESELLPTETEADNDNAGSNGSNSKEAESNSGEKNLRNFVITAEAEVAPRGDAAKIRANIIAIKLAKRLSLSGALATPEQLSTLVKYTGWGGLAAAFKTDNKDYQSLKDVMTDEEYESARASTTSSFYTPPYLVSAAWSMIEKLGFKGGNVLEPSGGIGHFFGLMPQSISSKSNLRGIELDNISGLIFKALYPDAKINISGYQEQRIPNNSMDLIVTNVPFGAVKVHDKNEKDISDKFDIHDYFIAKSIRKLKPGGIGVFITTTSTLDKSTALRNWIINEGNADFIDAVRLNTDTFKTTAGTEASSDIIIIRKRDNNGKSPYAKNMQDAVVEREATYMQDVKGHWGNVIRTEEKKAIMKYNKYFVENPNRMAGEMKFGFEGGNLIRANEQRCAVVKGIDQKAVLEQLTESLPSNISNTEITVTDKSIKDSDGTKEGGLTIINGKAYIIEEGVAVPVEWNTNKVSGVEKVELLRHYLNIKTSLNTLLDAEVNDLDGIDGFRKQLNTVYDSFVAKFGSLSNNTKINALKDDVDFPSISAIENLKDVSTTQGKREYEVSKSDIFSKRVIAKQQELKADNVADGIRLSIYKNGNVDIPFIAGMLGKTESEVTEDILKQKLGFMNPSTGLIEDKNEYLSGNVREKLAIAEQANTENEYLENITELQKVIPIDVPMHLINLGLGSTWVPIKVYTAWFKEAFGTDATFNKLSIDKYSAEIRGKGYGLDVQKGVAGCSNSDLALHAMNNTSKILYMDGVNDNGNRIRVKDPVGTAMAAVKQAELNEQFEKWARGNTHKFASEMEGIYNSIYRANVTKQTDATSFTSFPGATTAKIPFNHQKEAALRCIESATLLAQEVGTGKTIALISAAMEMRRLGTAKKPCIVVQRSTYKQFVKEIKTLYPSAKVLSPSAKDLTAVQRKQLFAKIAYNDWDIVVLYHGYLDGIPDDPKRVDQYIDDLIQEKLDMIDQIAEQSPENAKRLQDRLQKEIDKLDAGKSGNNVEVPEAKEKKAKSIKDIEKIRDKAKTKGEKLLDRRTDATMTFEQLGIDALLVDEAHAYKKLGFVTSIQGVKGIDVGASQRAQSMRLKTQYILENNQGKNVVFATGTPISNTMAEMWTYMRYLLPKSEMARLQISTFDSFVNNFGTIEEASEFTTSGKFKVTNRFSSYSNVPELLSIWRKIAYTTLTQDIPQLKEGVGTPFLESGKPIDIMLKQTRSLKMVMKGIKDQIIAFENMSGKEKKENSHIPLVMFGLAKRAAIDVRLVMPALADDPSSKTNETVRAVLADLKETESYSGTVAIFCDSYQSSDRKFNLFEDIKAKLIAEGVPEDQIAIINDYKSDDRREMLFEKLNLGTIRVVLGTTEKLGVGVNIQERLHMLVHMDAPIRPSDYQQRNGRIIRQGNSHLKMGKSIKVLRIGVEQTLDVTGYQRLGIKEKFINQIMKGDITGREKLKEEDAEGSNSSNYSQIMAKLSGSQAALAYEMERTKLERLENAKEYYNQDQAYINQSIRYNDNVISTTGARIKEFQDKLDKRKKLFPEDKLKTVTIGNTTATTPEELEILITKTIDKQVNKEVETLRANPNSDKAVLKLNAVINGSKFTFKYELTKTFDASTASKFKIFKELTYQSSVDPDLKRENGGMTRIEQAMEEIVSYMKAEYFINEIRGREYGLERAIRENKDIKPRLGVAFDRQDEIDASIERVNSLQEKMLQELAAIEAQEKEENITSIDISGAIQEEGNEVEIDGEDGPMFSTDTDQSFSIGDLFKGSKTKATEQAVETIKAIDEASKFADDVVVMNGKDALADLTKRGIDASLYKGLASDDWNGTTIKGKIYINPKIAGNQNRLAQVVIHEKVHAYFGDFFYSQKMRDNYFNKLHAEIGESEIKNFLNNAYWAKSLNVQAEEYVSHKIENLVTAIQNNPNTPIEQLLQEVLDTVPNKSAKKIILDTINKIYELKSLKDVIDTHNTANRNTGSKQPAGKGKESNDRNGRPGSVLDKGAERNVRFSRDGSGQQTTTDQGTEETEVDQYFSRPAPTRGSQSWKDYFKLATAWQDKQGSFTLKEPKSADFTSAMDLASAKRDFLDYRNSWNKSHPQPMVNGLKDKIVETVVQRMLPVEKIQSEVVRRGGTVNSNMDAVIEENESQSKNAHQMAEFDKDHTESIVKVLAKFAKKLHKETSEALNEIGDYIMAKHAPERNEFYRRQAAKETSKAVDKLTDEELTLLMEKAEKKKKSPYKGMHHVDFFKEWLKQRTEKVAFERLQSRDFARMTEWMGEEIAAGTYRGAAVVDDFANAKAQEFEDKFDATDIDNLWGEIRAINKYVMDSYLNSSRIDLKTYKELTTRWIHYVPMRGWENTTAGDVFDFNPPAVTGSITSALKTVKGGKSKADNPIGYVVSMAHSAIVEGNKNRIMLNVLNMVRANSKGNEDLFALRVVYKVNLEEKGKPAVWVETLEVPAKDLWDEGRVKKSNQSPDSYVSTPLQLQAGDVVAVENGLRIAIRFTDPQVAYALNGTNNKNTDPAVAQAQALMGNFTRWMSANWTSRSPWFIFSNTQIDLAFAELAHLIEKDGNFVEFNKALPLAANAIRKDIWGKLNPTYDAQGNPTNTDAYLIEWKENGGQTGFTHLKNVEKHKKNVAKLVSRLNQPGIIQGARSTLGFAGKQVINMSQWSEDLSRFSTYIASRKAGKDPKMSAYDSKQITVNFNTKGTWSSAFGMFYSFFNVGWQSLRRNVNIFRDNPRNAIITASSLAAMGFLAASAGAMWGDDDDEGNSLYYSLSDYDRYNKINIPKGKGFIQITVPHFFRAFYAMGVMAHEYSTGRTETGELVSKVLLNTASSFSPINMTGNQISENGDIYISTFTPTVIIPFFNVSRNKGTFGEMIYKEPFISDLDGVLPPAKMAMPYVNPTLKKMSENLNKAMGGSEYVAASYTFDPTTKTWEHKRLPAIVNFNPSTVEYVAQYVGGGRLKFWNQMYKIAVASVNGEDVKNLGTVPFWKEPRQTVNIAKAYYALKDEYGTQQTLSATIKKEVPLTDFFGKYYQPKLSPTAKMFSNADKQIGIAKDQYYSVANKKPDPEALRTKIEAIMKTAIAQIKVLNPPKK